MSRHPGAVKESSMKDFQKDCNFQNAKIFIFEANGFKSFAISSFDLSECHDIEKSSLSSLWSHQESYLVRLNEELIKIAIFEMLKPS